MAFLARHAVILVFITCLRYIKVKLPAEFFFFVSFSCFDLNDCYTACLNRSAGKSRSLCSGRQESRRGGRREGTGGQMMMKVTVVSVSTFVEGLGEHRQNMTPSVLRFYSMHIWIHLNDCCPNWELFFFSPHSHELVTCLQCKLKISI